MCRADTEGVEGDAADLALFCNTENPALSPLPSVLPTPTSAKALSTASAAAATRSRAVVVEPWEYSDVVHEDVATRKAAVWKRAPIIDAKTAAPFGLLKMSFGDEFEIAFMFLCWSIACLTPLLPIVWFFLPMSRLTSAVLAGLIVLSCTWPCSDWPVPPEKRWTMCVRPLLMRRPTGHGRGHRMRASRARRCNHAGDWQHATDGASHRAVAQAAAQSQVGELLHALLPDALRAGG